MANFPENLPEKLRRVRTQKGLSQEKLAELVGIKQNEISYYESGERCPSLIVLAKLATTLSVTTDYLLGIDGYDYTKDNVNVSDLSNRDQKVVRDLVSILKNNKPDK